MQTFDGRQGDYFAPLPVWLGLPGNYIQAAYSSYPFQPLPAMNSMSVYCLIFSCVLSLAATETFLVETHHDDTKQSVAPKTEADGKRPNEVDHKSVDSNKEEEQTGLSQVGHDYSSQAGSVVGLGPGPVKTIKIQPTTPHPELFFV